jgi:O-antigen/teichoic acid export membrane protein
MQSCSSSESETCSNCSIPFSSSDRLIPKSVIIVLKVANQELGLIDEPSVGSVGRAPAQANERPSRRVELAFLAWSSTIVKSAIMMATGFISTPLLLRYLGAERLGALRTSQQWMAYLGYLFFGLTPALSVLILRQVAKRDVAATTILVKKGVALQLRQAMIVVAPVAIVMAWCMPLLVPVSKNLSSELRMGALISVGTLLFSCSDVFRALLDCLQLGYLVNIGNIAQSLVATGVGILLGWLGFGLGGQGIAFLLAALVFLLAVGIPSLTRLPGFWRRRVGKSENREREELWRLRWPLALSGVGNQMNLQSDFMVVAMIAGPSAVTGFMVTQRLISVCGGVLGISFAQSSWAALVEILSNQGPKAFEKKLLELMRLLVGVGAVLFATLAAFDRQFVRLWVGSDYYGGDLLAVLTAIQLEVFAFLLMFTWVIDVQGDARERVVVSTIGSVLNLALSVVLGAFLGLYGVTLATIVAYLATDAWYCPWVFCRRYGVSARAIIQESARAIIIGAAWSVTIWIVSRHLSIGSWYAFSTQAGSAFALAVVYSAVFVLRKEDRALWMLRINRYLGGQQARGA